MEVIPEPVRHVNRPPEKREPLYFATGMELEPPIVNADTSLLVYCYEPNVGKYSTTNKPSLRTTMLPNNALMMSSRLVMKRLQSNCPAQRTSQRPSALPKIPTFSFWGFKNRWKSC
ncbi:hypothetical protein T265_07683 [Opisthorchis viverrini]|uniref:Uncharacterized protein n=1 Tax=Opisthorchis viverrini TaxID=6198 RepID=A0A074ZGF9_OPIVI|nr:hypothetical protein T265_07683 [Opisthorchis viverrini]KER24732.1 hypothetical protein T265_07683 [Opisthorchis viverrini]